MAGASERDVESLGESLIPVVDKLQEILHGAQLPDDCAVELPEVVVVGSQSSGKSSVLESLVGRDFLPRGSGICTRRPLVLHLRREPLDEAATEPQEWAEFTAHMPGTHFTDFDAVRKEIESETERLLGSTDKDVSDRPIHLTIHSPHVLTMSLVDLPGMTRVPVQGQPENIASKLRTLIMSYISNPSCIILAVSAANADLANSDAIALAREADPEGARTIGVLTKLDIMDKGTNALDMLANDVLPLRLGYIAVINRSQQDIQRGTPVQQARKNEADFFARHAQYKTVAAQCGIPALSRRIQAILVQHIEKRLPELRTEVATLEREKRGELRRLGTSVANGSTDFLRETMIRQLTQYSRNFSDGLQGRSAQGEGVGVSSDAELVGGARIRHVFQAIFASALDNLDPCNGLTDEQIWATMNNCAGVGRDVIVSKEAFEMLVRASMQQLHGPTQQCLSMVTRELLQLAQGAEPAEVLRYQNLHLEVARLVKAFIHAAAATASAAITAQLECEHAYINVDHPAFIGTRAAWQEHMQTSAAAPASDAGSADSDTYGVALPERGSSAGPHTRGRSTPHVNGRHHAYLLDAGAAGSTQSLGADESPSHQDSDQGSWFPFFHKRHDTESPRGHRPPRHTHGASGSGRPASLSNLKASDGAAGGRDGFASLVRAAPKLQRGGTGPMLPSAPSKLISRLASKDDRDAVKVMRRLVSSYFRVVLSTTKDMVPKIIMKYVVLHTEKTVHDHLITNLLKDDEHHLMAERPEVAERRTRLTNAVSVLSRALVQLQLLPQELTSAGGGADEDGGALASQRHDSGLEARGDAWAEGGEGAASPRGRLGGGLAQGGHGRRGSRGGDAAVLSARALEAHRGLNVSMAIPLGVTARAVALGEGTNAADTAALGPRDAWQSGAEVGNGTDSEA